MLGVAPSVFEADAAQAFSFRLQRHEGRSATSQSCGHVQAPSSLEVHHRPRQRQREALC